MNNFTKVHWKSLDLFHWYERLILQLSFILLRILFMLRFFNNVNIQLKEDNYGHLRRLQLVLYESDHIATVVYINDAVNFPSNLIIDKIVEGEITDYHYRHQVIIHRLLFRETEGELETIHIRDPFRFSIMFTFLLYLLGILWGLISSILAFIIVSYYLFLLVKEYTLLYFCLSRWNSPPNRSFPHRRSLHESSKQRLVLQRSDIQKTLNLLNALIGVKAGRGLIKWFVKIIDVIRGSKTSAIVRSSVVLVAHFHSIYRCQGRKGLVLRLKSYYILTMQAMGGQRIKSTQALGPAIGRNRYGLPSIIPRQHRILLIHGKDRLLLRIYLSWFSLYRVIDFKGSVKLSTITNPGVNFKLSFVKEMLLFIQEFFTYHGFNKPGDALVKLKKKYKVSFCRLNKTTPSIAGRVSKVSSSILGILSAAWALKLPENADILHSFRYFLLKMDNSLTIDGLKHQEIEEDNNHFWRLFKWLAELPGDKWSKFLSSKIGKLGFKSEAAGKVRVFAMVDCWTQWLLRPLHLYLFDFLKGLDTDGTHDQLAPIERLIEDGNNRFWCFDLSAATDRLPMLLQVHIINYLLGSSLGYAWEQILVGRWYYVPRTPKGSKRLYALVNKVKYAVGQPMGALSSWAMLAVSHHLIVAWAAKRAGFKMGEFEGYAVLGDDIVLANGRVATEYCILMKELGVGIGIHKSLKSRKGALEFAKRYFIDGVDCSPVPFKELVAAIQDFEYSTTFAKKYELGARAVASLLGYGYKVKALLSAAFERLPKRLRTFGLQMYSPWNSEYNLSTWLNINSFVIDPSWIVMKDEMWPELSDPHASTIKSWALKDENRVEKMLLENNSDKFNGRCNKRFVSWMEDGLWDSIGKLGLSAVALQYRTLYFIHREILESSFVTSRRDLKSFKEIFMSLRHANIPLDESKIMRWFDARLLSSNITRTAILGESPKIKSKPSVLMLARMKLDMRKKVK